MANSHHGDIDSSPDSNRESTTPLPSSTHPAPAGSISTPSTSGYESFWKLPRLTLICGTAIIAFGLVNLILMLLKIGGQGLIWLFFYSIPANTAISVFPHEPAIVFCGQHFSAVVVALVAVAGNLAAGWVDYHFFTPLLQMKFAASYKKAGIYQKALRWFSAAPFWVVVLFALTPLPFYLVKFLVFSSGYSMRRYMVGIFVGRVPRFYLLALLGHFLKISTPMMIIFFSVIFVIYLLLLVRAWLKARTTRSDREMDNPAE